MNNQLLITFEILLVVVSPLAFSVSRGKPAVAYYHTFVNGIDL